MNSYTFRSTEWFEVKADTAQEALNILHKRGIYPEEFRNESKYDDDWHGVDYVIND